MAKGDQFYFNNFAECAALSKRAAAYLVECMKSFDPKQLERMIQKMHEIEHQADIKKHEMNDALAKAFVTPVDREDLDMLSHNLDQVTDRLEEIIQKFYIYDIRSIEPEMIEFAGKLCVTTEFAPTITLSPIVTPGIILTPSPIQTLFPILTGFDERGLRAGRSYFKSSEVMFP